jgi:hypothetical protein
MRDLIASEPATCLNIMSTNESPRRVRELEAVPTT